jgi:hypothetical protein
MKFMCNFIWFVMIFYGSSFLTIILIKEIVMKHFGS